jgi:spore coat polysaccharide biosynthesis protein SpsF (cytidylyltransferase family)
MRKVVAIIQARMSSSRLPGKVLKKIVGEPVLWHVINRLKEAKLVDAILVATTSNALDKPLINLMHSIGIQSYAGSEQDVLDRYYQASKISRADVVVRITSDCPLLDPKVVDTVISYFLNNDFDYASNTCGGFNSGCKETYPDGLDTEVFSFAALENAWKNAVLQSEREHVTAFIWKNPAIFKIGHVVYPKDLSKMRWTVDYEQDFLFVSEIYNRLSKKGLTFGMDDILSLLETHPELTNINSNIMRNEGYLKSLKEDKSH